MYVDSDLKLSAWILDACSAESVDKSKESQILVKKLRQASSRTILSRDVCLTSWYLYCFTAFSNVSRCLRTRSRSLSVMVIVIVPFSDCFYRPGIQPAYVYWFVGHVCGVFALFPIFCCFFGRREYHSIACDIFRPFQMSVFNRQELVCLV